MKISRSIRAGFFMAIASATLLCGIRDSIAGEPDQRGIDANAELGASFFLGLLANNQSIVSFDVTTTLETVYSSPGTPAYFSKQIERRLWSRRDSKHLLVRSIEIEQTHEEPSILVRGAAFSESSGLVIFDSRGKRRVSSPSLAMSRYNVGWPDIQTIGMVGYPHIHFEVDEHSWWDSLAVPAAGTTARFMDDDRAEVSWDGSKRDSYSVRHQWTFNVHTLMPERRVVYVAPKEGKPYIKEREQYSWKRLEGGGLPSAIIKDVLQVHVDAATGSPTPYTVMTDARFEWHRVNEEIADAEFSPDRFRSLADLRAFLTFGGHGEVKPQR